MSVVPGDPFLSPSRLQGARPEISTSSVLWKLSGTMFFMYLLIVGVSAFTIQPEERTGEKGLFHTKGLACSFSGESECLPREVLFLSKTRCGYQRGRRCERGQIGDEGKLDFGW